MQPAVQYKPFLLGTQDPIVPGDGGDAGAEDLALLVPPVEMLSAGFPPVPPAFVTKVQTSSGVRRVATASGHAVTSALATTRGRSQFDVGWGLLTADRRDALIAFLRDEVVLDVDGGSQGSVYAMTVEVDGPGTDSAAKLRIAAVPTGWETLLVRLSGTNGLYSVGPFTCEETL